jgi:hypothetical protein
MRDTATCEVNVLACDRPSLWRHHTDETDFAGHFEYRGNTYR